MNIFVLTGAGVSAESGLGTFRDKAGTGIWAKSNSSVLVRPCHSITCAPAALSGECRERSF